MEFEPTVFLIDDDTDDQEIFSIAVNEAKKSAKCIFADDGVQALEKINKDKDFVPDFIFIDMNMPRMNGQQCLTEIKKIDRLKHVPVYIYSTSADPSAIAENLKLGAADFIVKPSDIKTLTRMLAGILQKKMLTVMMCIFWLCTLSIKSYAQSDTLPAVKELKKLSVEELMDIMVTTVSKTPEKLSKVASAIQVVTNEEINRSSSMGLPAALRLLPNIAVAQSGSHDWGISARGFNGTPVQSSSLADKLLVLIDGRTVYNPLFGGVYWDVQNVLLNDVDRIEVNSGPGGSIWGANAVNGIVNIISKPANETQGTYVSSGGGSHLENFVAMRYGSHIDTSVYFRVYGQRFEYGPTSFQDLNSAHDSWHMSQAGFRMDVNQTSKNSFTLQGDLYGGSEDEFKKTLIDGQNILGRWTHTISDKSDLIVQAYFDRTYRFIQTSLLKEECITYDIDMQNSIRIGERNRVVWGLSYRISHDDINMLFDPPNKSLQLFGGFVQDQYSLIPSKLELTVGTKILHNDYTDFEYQPTVRLAMTPDSMNTIWVAVSRAVRTPTRFESDYNAPILGSYGNFDSEEVIAYEAGYRTLPFDQISVSVAGFYNQYTNLRSIDINASGPPTYYFANNLEANTYGFEISAKYIATDWLRLRGGYTYLHEEFTTLSPNTFPNTEKIEALDPKHQFLIQSLVDVTRNVQVDGVVRYVSELPTRINGTNVPSYATFDLRVSWEYKYLTVCLNGQNLAQKYHREFGNKEIPRRITAQLTLKF